MDIHDLLSCMTHNYLTSTEIYKKVNNRYENVDRNKLNMLLKEGVQKRLIQEKARKKKGTLKKYKKVKQDYSTPRTQVKDKHFIGKAGEYSVAGELLFRGYNSSIVPVDKGVDILALKDNKSFEIQVKTSAKNENSNKGPWSFSITSNVLSDRGHSRYFYICVIRQYDKNYKNTYIVLPSNKIQELIDHRIINNENSISLRITKNNEKYYLGRDNNSVDITSYVNSFDIIK